MTIMRGAYMALALASVGKILLGFGWLVGGDTDLGNMLIFEGIVMGLLARICWRLEEHP